MALNHGTKPIVTDGLVLCLDAADENSYPGSGTTWTDLSGEGNNATLSGPTYNASGYFTFDGSNDYADTSNVLGLTDWPFTFSAWVRSPSSASGTDNIMALADQSTNIRQCYMAIATNDKFLITIQNSGYLFVYCDDDSDVRDSLWYNYVVSYISNTERKAYINGVLNSSFSAAVGSITTDIAFSSLWDSFDIGRLGRSSHTDYLKGDIAISCVYNRELTAAEVKQNFNAHRHRFGV